MGTGKTLTAAGSVNDGNGGRDYAVTFAGNTTGTITPVISTSTTVVSSQSSAVYGTPVTFTATVTAQSGTTAPGQGSVDFFDTTAGRDLGNGTFGNSSGLASTWTLLTGAKTFHVTTGDTITATYTAATGFGGSPARYRRRSRRGPSP